jgi:ribose/xylose/arabinose/galactoside ABC-type transport system permease subunit
MLLARFVQAGSFSLARGLGLDAIASAVIGEALLFSRCGSVGKPF